MQGLLAPAPNPPSRPERLSSSNLAHHTSLHPPAPRRTVQAYLATTPATPTAFEDPPLSPTKVAAEFDGVNTPPRFRAWRDARLREGAAAQGGAVGLKRPRRVDEALVLHRPGDGDGGDTAAPRAKKPLLVQAMRGRVSSSTALASAPEPAVGRKRVRDGEGEGDAASATSSILVPRAERAHVKEGRKKGKGKETETEKKKKPGKALKGGKLRAEAEGEDELDEIEQRLRDRRERRRAKALIRKDRTLTAAAVGTAAAEKVKASRRRRRAASDRETDEEDQENEGVARKKVKRTTKEGRSRKVVQEMGKAKNVTSGRLTLKPKPTIGIFNKGKASARTKLGGKGIPDLAFSERAFLHGPASSASSSSSSSSSSSASSSEDSLPAPVEVPRRRTYGSKPANRTSLSRRASSSWPAVAPEPASFDTPLLPSSSPAPAPAVPAPAPGAASASHSKARRSLTRRFSHVELPLRTSSPAASSAAAALRNHLGSGSGARSAESLARAQRLSDRKKDPARAAQRRQHEARRPSSAVAPEPALEDAAADEVEPSEGAVTDDVERLLREVESAEAGVEPSERERRSEVSYGGGAGDFGDALDAVEGDIELPAWDAPAADDSPVFARDDEQPVAAYLDVGPGTAFDLPHDPVLEPLPPFDNLGAPLPSSSPSLSIDAPVRPPSSLDAPRRFSSTRLDPQATLLHDDGAYRAAMRAQWPRTTL
ncbi:hypothetical protein JCM8208_007499 [Rhodotorula glutinis]